MDNLTEIIRNRHSSRSYTSQFISPEIKNELTTFIESNSLDFRGMAVSIRLIEKAVEGSERMKLNYGLITGHHTYLLGEVNDNWLSRVSYGYVMEKVVLKATSLGLDSCWVGYFDHQYFTEAQLTEGKDIPSIVIIGHSVSNKPIMEKLIRKATGAEKRKPWSDLFFNYSTLNSLNKEEAGVLTEPLEMLRLAPSSGNTQPWRVFYNKGNSMVHFLKKPVSSRYEKDGMHDVDMGIALSHFDLTVKQLGVKGSWTLNEKPAVMHEGLTHVISWKMG